MPVEQPLGLDDLERAGDAEPDAPSVAGSTMRTVMPLRCQLKMSRVTAATAAVHLSMADGSRHDAVDVVIGTPSSRRPRGPPYRATGHRAADTDSRSRSPPWATP